MGRAVGKPDGLAPPGKAVGRPVHCVLLPPLPPVPVLLELEPPLEHAVTTPIVVTPARAIAPTRNASGPWSRMHILLLTGIWNDLADQTLADVDE